MAVVSPDNPGYAYTYGGYASQMEGLEGSFKAEAEVVASYEDIKHPTTTIVEIPSITYDEITYEHDIYKSIGSQNPSLGYVWIAFPQFSSSIETPKDLMNKLSTVSKETFEELDKSKLDYPPQNLISFSISRYLMGVGNFTIVLFDSEYTKIESRILKNKGIIAFKYGYSSNEEKASPWHVGLITAYSLGFMLEGTQISIAGVSTGWVMNTVKKPLPLKGYTGTFDPNKKNNVKISDYILGVADTYGFDKEHCLIEPTLPVNERGVNLKDNDSGHIPLNAITSETTFEHIANTLRPYSVNAQQQGGYVFYVEPTTEGAILHYHTIEFLNKNTRRLFTQFKNPNTVVRSFQPDWGMSLVQMRRGGKTSAISFDIANKKVIKTTISSRAGKTQLTGGTKSPSIPVIPDGTEEVTYNVPTNATTLAGQKTAVNASMAGQLSQAVKGTLVIQGTSEIKMLETIAVHVYIPKGPHSVNKETGNRLIHWISGDFKVIKITDKIEKGDFSTTLDLAFGGRELIVEGDDAIQIGVMAPQST